MARFAAGLMAFALLTLSASARAFAQEAKSPSLAKQLAAALDGAKLDSIAAKDPAAPDTFFAALYFPGSQLLVVSARYASPPLLDARLQKREYRDIYIDLNSASVPQSKLFIEDAGADGLRAKREEGQAFDTYELAGKPIIFDGDWKKQKLSEQEYMKAFTTADDRYSGILTALIAQLKKPS